jgi:hypothetical protein
MPANPHRIAVVIASAVLLAGCVAGCQTSPRRPVAATTTTQLPSIPRPAAGGYPCSLLTVDDLTRVFDKPFTVVGPQNGAGVDVCDYRFNEDAHDFTQVVLEVWPTDDEDWREELARNIGPASGTPVPQLGSDAFVDAHDSTAGARRGSVKLRLRADLPGFATGPQLEAMLSAILFRWHST